MDLIDFYRVKVETVNEDGQLLNTDALFSIRAILYLAWIIEDFSSVLPNSNERQDLFVQEACFKFTFKVGEKNLSKLLNRDQAFFVFNHFVQLLFKVVEYAIVHDIFVNFTEDIAGWATTGLHNFLKVVLDKFTSHGLGTFLSIEVFLRLPVHNSFTDLAQHLLVDRLLLICLPVDTVVADA